MQNEGLMYNPVSMKIEDPKRLQILDLKQKNKKARFEVRYDVEATIRKEAMAEKDRVDQMRLNKISGLRYKEGTERGFDIVTGDKLEGPAVTYMQNQVSNSGPVKAWNQALANANGNAKIDELKAKLEEEDKN